VPSKTGSCDYIFTLSLRPVRENPVIFRDIIDGRFSWGIRVISNEYEVDQSLRPAKPPRLTSWLKDKIAAIPTGAFEAINNYDFVYTDPYELFDLLPPLKNTPRPCS
jgi:hypothetical protein